MTRANIPRPFTDRHEAGVALAKQLERYRGRRSVVLALPRGGVPVAYEVAVALDADLDIFIVRKVGMPGHREFAVGAIASGGVLVLDRDVLHRYSVPQSAVDAVIRDELEELDRREREYRRAAALTPLKGRIVILVDDGLATGSTMKAAVQAVRQHQPASVVVAAPVGAPSTCEELTTLADDVVCARTPDDFAAVGQWYVNFSQTTDLEVHALLKAYAERLATAGDHR